MRGIGLVARDIGGNLEYYLFNGHGDVVERTSANGTTLKRYDYDAFGVEREPELLDCNPFRYCCEYYDKEAETYYLRNRDYNPSTGRFTQEDPIRDGRNWYTYADNNPVMFADPLGLSTVPGQIVADLPEHLARALREEQFGSSESSGTRPGTVIAVMDLAGNWRSPSAIAGDAWYAPPLTGGMPIVSSQQTMASPVGVTAGVFSGLLRPAGRVIVALAIAKIGAIALNDPNVRYSLEYGFGELIWGIENFESKAQDSFDVWRDMFSFNPDDVWDGLRERVLSGLAFAKKYQKPLNPNRRKGADTRGPNPDAPGKNEQHGDCEQHSQRAKGHKLPRIRGGR